MKMDLIHLRMNTDELKNYIRANKDIIFIITVCSCDIGLKKGSFTRALLWNGKKRINSMSIDNITSANKCALYGLLDGAKNINKAKKVALVSSVSLGFIKCERGKGVNSDICNQILTELREKGCNNIADIMVKGGASYLKNICGVTYKKNIIKADDSVNVINRSLSEEQIRGLEKNAARLNTRADIQMKILLRETKELGKTEKLVSLIRKLEPGIEISTAAKFYDVDENFIIKIQNLISVNPEMDDEEIAELWMRF